MTRLGRRPLATGHVKRLTGSDSAKQRLRVLLQTLRSELSVPEACACLGIRESRFHALRNAWLQQALELLEPRPLGRPRHETDPAELQARIDALEAENQTLRQQLASAEVRREVAEILPDVVPAADEPRKKGAPIRPYVNRRRAR
jgi:hypothetical protein